MFLLLARSNDRRLWMMSVLWPPTAKPGTLEEQRGRGARGPPMKPVHLLSPHRKMAERGQGHLCAGRPAECNASGPQDRLLSGTELGTIGLAVVHQDTEGPQRQGCD